MKTVNRAFYVIDLNFVNYFYLLTIWFQTQLLDDWSNRKITRIYFTALSFTETSCKNLKFIKWWRMILSYLKLDESRAISTMNDSWSSEYPAILIPSRKPARLNFHQWNRHRSYLMIFFPLIRFSSTTNVQLMIPFLIQRYFPVRSWVT